MAPDPSHFVADSIEDRLPEVRLHRADVSRLEGVQSAEHVKHRLLNQVAGIEAAPHRGRQPAVGPPLEVRDAPLQEGFDGRAVAGLRPQHELDRRLVAEQRAVAFLVRRRDLAVPVENSYAALQ